MLEDTTAIDAVPRRVSFERPPPGDLRRTSIRGGLSTLTAEIVGHVLRVASMIVLARWLMPEHFGLIGMVTALTVFAERFKDLGLDVATVQRDNLTHQQVSTLFWINLGVGTAIAVAVAACAPLVAAFYGEPRLLWIAVVLASTFLLGGLTIQHQALLRRQMRFGDLAWVNVTSAALGFVSGIALAWYGFGYWALVWREVVRTAAVAAGVWILCPWQPGRPQQSPEIRSMIQAGGGITGFNIVYFLSRSFDQIVIGKVWGAGPLGFYRQAHQLLMLPLSLLHFPAEYVAMPVLSALRTQPDKYRSCYRDIIALISFVSLPVLAFLGIHAEHVIALALGEKWLPAAPIFRIMAIAGLAWPIAGTAGTVMISHGKNMRYFWLGTANAVLLIAAFLIGVRKGPIGVATAYALWTYATLLPSLAIAFYETPLRLKDPFEAAARSLIATVACACVLLLGPAIVGDRGRIAELSIGVVVGALAYFGTWTILPGGKQRLFLYVEQLLATVRRQQASRAQVIE